MRILYVDDEPDIREIAAFALSLNPAYDVRPVGSGAEGVAMLRNDGWRPDIMLLDVMMPGMDGPQTLAAVRDLPVGHDLPVIFITARVLASERERLLGLGAIGVIAKPFDPMRLAAEVGALAGRAR
jgi:two-component system, OmpR family, response regulator